MEYLLTFLGVVVAILAVLQGWHMIRMKKRNNSNPIAYTKPNHILEKLEEINKSLDEINRCHSRMEQRLTDVWEKVSKQ